MLLFAEVRGGVVMANLTAGSSGLLKRCAQASRKTGGMIWATLGIAFLVFGISSSVGAYVGMGAAFLAIGLGLVMRKPRRVSPE
jgi:hypothetical protein